jgi:amino-acid N-acetyltransferase
VTAIHELIRTFADRKLMIRRSLGELYESIREFLVATDEGGEGRVIGCAALHVFWEDLAELKCLAVS